MDVSENQLHDDLRKGLEDGVKAMKANQEIIEMGFNEQAKMLKSVYDAYIKAGFNEDQAFELIKTRGMNIT